MSCSLEIVKSFAGPIATVIGASAAVWVTWRIGNGQLEIARRQAATAEAQHKVASFKLKHDLFEKRYRVYIAAKAVIERVSGSVIRPTTDADLMELRVKLDEARFFFPPETVSFLERIESITRDHEIARILWTANKDNEQIRADQGDIMATALDDLAKIYSELPSRMEDVMGFSNFGSSIPRNVDIGPD